MTRLENWKKFAENPKGAATSYPQEEQDMKAAYLFVEKCPNYELAFQAINLLSEDELLALETYICAGTWGLQTSGRFSTKSKIQAAMDDLLNPAHPGVIIFAKRDWTPLVTKPSYVVQLDSIERSLATKIHEGLRHNDYYYGLVEVAPEVPIHRTLFSGYGPLAIVEQGKVFILCDQHDEVGATIGQEMLDCLTSVSMRFMNAEVVDVNYRHSAFDSRTTFHRNLDLQKSVRQLTDQWEVVAERVIYKLSDVIPESVEALEAAIAKLGSYLLTSDDCSHIAVSCRRCLERAADRLEPATNRNEDGKYKERLHRYVQNRFSATRQYRQYLQAELVELSTRIDKLYNMGNAGVHDDWHRSAFATVVMRVILLLDELLAPLPPANPITLLSSDLFRPTNRITQ